MLSSQSVQADCRLLRVDIPNLPSLIDAYTPDEALHRVGFDGKNYDLVFSDEFEVDGRTFNPGEDPFFEAASGARLSINC